MGGGCRRAGTTATCFSLDDQEEEVEKIVHVTMAAPVALFHSKPLHCLQVTFPWCIGHGAQDTCDRVTKTQMTSPFSSCVLRFMSPPQDLSAENWMKPFTTCSSRHLAANLVTQFLH